MTRQHSLSHEPTIRLQSGERLKAYGRPKRRLITAWSVGQGFGVGIPIGIFIGMIASASWGALAGLVASLASYLFFRFIARRRWAWHRWWLTNKRLVVRHGFIGYQLQSVPLDRIVDVTLKVSWWDRIWGLQHVNVRDMTGEVSSSQVSVGLRLLAVSNAEELAEDILTMSPKLVERDEDMSEVVSLLRQLVQAAS